MLNDKQPIIDFLNHHLALATIIGLIFVAFWVVGIIGTGFLKRKCYISIFFKRFALPLGFFAALGGTLMSLFYSDYLGVLPCGLCWFQRVALYSLVFVFGVAWFKKDKNIFPYILTLSIFGEVVALYHHYLQMGYSELMPCPVVASTIDCAKPTFVEYGFVTFPLMSAVMFAFLIVLSLVNMYDKRNN